MNTRDALSGLPCARAFAESLREVGPERKVMAQELATLATSYETVILDAGTTALLVAEAVMANAAPKPTLIVTPNLAVSLVLGADSLPCVQLAGLVDDLHLCVIPEPAQVNQILRESCRGESLFILTGAAFRVSQSGLDVRARRPDQFGFKCAAVALASHVVVVAEYPKFYLPFDGQYAFTLVPPTAHVWLGYSAPDRSPATEAACVMRKAGFCVTEITDQLTEHHGDR